VTGSRHSSRRSSAPGCAAAKRWGSGGRTSTSTELPYGSASQSRRLAANSRSDPPKTAGSAAGVGLSGRVLAALEVQRDAQVAERGQWATAYVDHDLVFARQDGEPLRPRYILARFHAISDKAGLPRARIHDLRHLAATLMISSGVPLPLVSKTLRHSRIAITADLYGHLTEEAAHAAATGLESVLNAAKAERDAKTAMRSETTSRQHRAFST